MFRRSREHDSIPQLTMRSNLLLTASELSYVLHLGRVRRAMRRVHSLFDFRSLYHSENFPIPSLR